MAAETQQDWAPLQPPGAQLWHLMLPPGQLLSFLLLGNSPGWSCRHVFYSGHSSAGTFVPPHTHLLSETFSDLRKSGLPPPNCFPVFLALTFIWSDHCICSLSWHLPATLQHHSLRAGQLPVSVSPVPRSVLCTSGVLSRSLWNDWGMDQSQETRCQMSKQNQQQGCKLRVEAETHRGPPTLLGIQEKMKMNNTCSLAALQGAHSRPRNMGKHQRCWVSERRRKRNGSVGGPWKLPAWNFETGQWSTKTSREGRALQCYWQKQQL